ncbi:MAG: rhodanese-like domain-containing protein [Thermoflavifilum aggregans]|nr:rhodanese-like domain-containing protein [Thermoflavifilum aggregans]
MQRKMWKFSLLISLALIGSLWISSCGQSASQEPWTDAELLSPDTLAAWLRHPEQSPHPIILDVGPAGVIPGARELGPAHEAEGMAHLKSTLSQLPKNSLVVIYCGCCPFSKCPNVRPAFRLVKQMGFTHARLLNLSDNLKKDWIDKGYPIENP